MKPLQELCESKKQELVDKRLLAHFRERFIVVEMYNKTPNKKCVGLADWERLVIVDHPTDEEWWFVSASILSDSQWLALTQEGFNCRNYRGKVYIPLLLVEEITGEKFLNIRNAVKDSVTDLRQQFNPRKTNE